MNFDTTSVFAAILAATLIVHGANWMVNASERVLLRWRPQTAVMVDAGD
jgi:ABC-type nitrate/sulfonate/bicarbonate transport system permease component